MARRIHPKFTLARLASLLALTVVVALPVSAIERGAHYGAALEPKDAMAADQAVIHAAHLGDKTVQIRGTVTAACEKKGCWMALRAGEGKTLRMTFRDYGFFVPLEIVGETVVAEGKIAIVERSVADQKHLLEDAGRPQEEIDAIREPIQEVSFVADGVVVVSADAP